MSWRVHRRAALAEQIDVAAGFLLDESENIELVSRFYLRVEDGADQLIQNPFLAQRERVPGWPEFRLWPIDGFSSYAFVYRVLDDVIDIAHFMHLARDLPRALDRGL